MDLPAFLTPALVAYLFLALAGLIDKVLLQTSIVSPRAYAFFVGILSVAAVVLLPFGVVNIPDRRIFFAALVSGVAGVFAPWSLYSALQEDDAPPGITPPRAV